MVTCHTTATTTTLKYPHPNRVAATASILYLNDDFDGGEFYFANHRYHDSVGDGVAGRMIYFTSGVDNLHGALPVLRQTRGKEG